MSLWIKICANTSLDDALLAAEAGADAVGFVFAPSPRHVTREQVAAIVPHLPSTLEKVGVFVDATFEEIAATVESSGLTGVQLHFNAAPELPAQLRARFGTALRLLRVVHFDPEKTSNMKGTDLSLYASGINSTGALHLAERLDALKGHDRGTRDSGSRAANGTEPTRPLGPEGYFSDVNVDAILVDSHTPTTVGGTGIAFDWTNASKTLFRNNSGRKLIVAGGLTPENVAEAIATLRPWGVDVVSGVEASPGRKDPAKVKAFIANANAARCQQ